MRTFELVTLVFLLVPSLFLLWAKPPLHRLLRVSSVAALISLGIHAGTEGMHWQLLPLYLSALLLFVLFFTKARSRAPVVRITGYASMLLIFCAATFSLILPMFRLPAPSGSYPVGTTILYLVDSSRLEVHLNPPGNKRELMVQAWYPAGPSRAPLAPYRRWVETTKLSSYMAVLKTHSRVDAPVSSTGAPFPVLLFNPAWQNQRTQNTFQIEDLASNGFVVIAIDHTYNSQPIAFPDGRRLDSKNIDGIGDFDHFTLAQEIMRGDAEADYEAADDIYVLDALAQMNQNSQSPFFRRVDVDRTGAFGHSFGGGVSMEASRRDPRIRAAMNMDGWIFGDVARLGLPKPLLLMYGGSDPVKEPDISVGSFDTASGRLAGLNEHDLEDIKATMSKFGGYVLSLQDAHVAHFNFSDRALYSPIRKLAESGPVDPRRAHQIIEAYTLAFFSHVLKGTSEPILEPGARPFPEATLDIWKPAGPAN